MRRRDWLAAAALPWLAGCGSRGNAAGDERIVDLASGRSITRAQLVERARGSDYVLLGELHDNPHHHARRGELIAALAPAAEVVAEHLPRGSTMVIDGSLLASLEAAGFDAKGWRWPLHEPLFAAIARAGLRLTGGNAPRDLARRVAREGEAAQPPELRAVLPALGAPAREALDADLVRGHCGQLAGTRLDAMRAAQRVRDASMWLAMRDARSRGARPVVLVAGNGHVRRDYGMAQLIAAAEPTARVLSVAFVEPGDVAELTLQQVHCAWVTAAVDRPDPCAGFTLPARR